FQLQRMRVSQPHQQLLLHVTGYRNSRHHLRPELERRARDERSGEPDRRDVVVQIGAPATVVGITAQPQAWCTLLPGASASEVVAAGIGQEDVGAMVETLGTALQLASECG